MAVVEAAAVSVEAVVAVPPAPPIWGCRVAESPVRPPSHLDCMRPVQLQELVLVQAVGRDGAQWEEPVVARDVPSQHVRAALVCSPRSPHSSSGRERSRAAQAEEEAAHGDARAPACMREW